MTHDYTQEQLSSNIEKIIRLHIGSDTQLETTSDLLNDLGMDSLELVELGLKLEKAFGTRIASTELRRCITVEEVIELVAQSGPKGSVQSS